MFLTRGIVLVLDKPFCIRLFLRGLLFARAFGKELTENSLVVVKGLNLAELVRETDEAV